MSHYPPVDYEYKSKTPASQDNYTPHELKIILAAHNQGISAEDLTHKINRSAKSISVIACKQGVSLRRAK